MIEIIAKMFHFAAAMILAAAIITSAVIVGGALLLQSLGVAWAPFAALISGFQARKVGLSFRRYTIAGAMYSVLFLVPWVHLLGRFQDTDAGKHLPSGFLHGWIKIFVPALLLANAVIYGVILELATISIFSWESFKWSNFYYLHFWLMIAPVLVPAAVGLIFWINSTGILRFRDSIECEDGETHSVKSPDLLIRHTEIMPFVHVSVTIVSVPVSWLLMSIGFHWSYR